MKSAHYLPIPLNFPQGKYHQTLNKRTSPSLNRLEDIYQASRLSKQRSSKQGYFLFLQCKQSRCFKGKAAVTSAHLASEKWLQSPCTALTIVIRINHHMTKAMCEEEFPGISCRNTLRGHQDRTAVKIRSWAGDRGGWTCLTLDIMLLQCYWHSQFSEAERYSDYIYMLQQNKAQLSKLIFTPSQ